MSSGQIAAFLDERERLFARAYDRSLNGTAAAIEAGYQPGKNNAAAAARASRLLRDARIQAYRAALQRESVEDMAVTKDSVVLRLLEVYRRCMAAEPVLRYEKETKTWVESGEWKFDAAGALRALQQLARILGYDAPAKTEAETGGGIEELLREAEEGRSY